MVQLALAQAGMCAGDSDRTVSASALYLTAKALARQKDWPKVIEKVRPFMDDGWYILNVPDLTGPALMLLGRAYMEVGQLDPSRQAWSKLLEWLPRSALFDEAVYSIGLVLEKQGQRDPAVDTYRRIAGSSTSEFAAKAQLQIGLCRSAQNRLPEALDPLLLAATIYEVPELQAQACFEAAQIQQKLKKPEEAAKLLQKVVADFGKSPWAQKARDKLNEMSAAQ
jgi:tetratricopeptide (TPR) repeat protein